VNREEYYPFGETCFGAFAKKRYRYVGKEKDNETGLYYYGARYYAAWTCRFVSVDPLADRYMYLTPYNYAGNKPIGDLDIDGMQSTGDPPKKKDPRVFDDGTNRKVGPRTLDDPNYEVHNLPTNPKHGQVATYGYSRGKDAAVVDYVFNSNTSSWERTIRDRALNVVEHGDFAVPGLFSESASDTLGEGGSSTPSDGATTKSSVKKGEKSTSQSKTESQSTDSPFATSKLQDKLSGVPGSNLASPAKADVAGRDNAQSRDDVDDFPLNSTIEYFSKTIETSADETIKSESHYKSRNPIDSTAAIRKANTFLTWVREFAHDIGKFFGLLDIAQTVGNILTEAATTGRILIGDIVDLIWMGIVSVFEKVVSKFNPVLGLFVSSVDYILDVMGAKEYVRKLLNDNSPVLR
jgi:RHS repeat-associated protein